LKYFVLGSLSSGILLYGASLTYGYAGTTEFAGILSTLTQGDVPLGLLFGLVFLITGLAFKVSAVPFHMWTPDVYEGSPTPVTAFFATAPKVAAMALLARLMYDAFGAIPGQWGQVIALLAVLSMFLGAIAAIGQRDIKRLMAYSSIAHMGFALIGLASGTAFGVQAMLIYMAIYVSMNIGTFAFILSMERDGVAVTSIDSLNMLSKKAPLQAFAMLVLLFSLAGVPPMLGFFGKFYVLQAAVDANMTWLALAGAIASVIGAFYYLRIVFFMYFGKEGDGIDARIGGVQWAALMGSALIMVFGIVNLFGVESVALAAAEALVR
jgi:NADH-quinone oxidoreductase subunit N